MLKAATSKAKFSRAYPPPPPPPPGGAVPPPPGASAPKCEAPASLDTNIMSVELGFLNEEVPIRVGDPITCKYCQSILSYLDTVKDGEWTCHFCSTKNTVSGILPEEIPDAPILDYVLEAPITKTDSEKTEDNGTIVYCIDTSGSMSINVDLTNNGVQLTRLDVVKNAMCQQLKNLKEKSPNQKICVVQFSKDVKILGDCTHNAIIVKSNLLSDYDGLVDLAKEKVTLSPLSTTLNAILKKVKDLEEQGSTALGPALLISTIIAGKEKNGKVILCTDGTANNGLGNLEEDPDVNKAFYEKIGQVAKSSGVIININTLKGCDANLKRISPCTVECGGSVLVVDPKQVADAFNDALGTNVIATDVEIGIYLHPAVYINDSIQSEQPSRRQVSIGNVNDDTTYQFKYSMRSEEETKAFGEMKNFPVQVQIKYTKLNGFKGIRVISKTVEIAEEKEEVKVVDGDVLQTYYIQQTAIHKRRNSIENARQNMSMFRMAQEASAQPMQEVYKDYADDMEEAMDASLSSDEDAEVYANATTWNAKKAKKYSTFSSK
ncbi:hypothetical protein EIN_474480 [Entamoeba invadens IP1]|uniref:VWFA domain-containing protein n=1 Tax=Entamoeba invadens IP1 TaxID=370355 RepID=A0A0A1U3V8_ENTIV|nr:hypothetical protein EIN_474480 [Entamoeba invadens IP1]ELP88846.1 hypothetical protein EIN_474480 [Entamoeba invadens IP1]|eukprot:XP_004255617.1 hypothetical protein EIN_474480 [Entamoeba invadens IP1]